MANAIMCWKSQYLRFQVRSLPVPYHHQDHLLHQVPSLESSPSAILMALVVHHPWLVGQCFPPSLPKEFWKQASKQCHSILPNHYLKFSSHYELDMGSKKSGWPGQCECCLVSTSSHARMLTSMSYCIGMSSLSHVQTYRAFFLDSVFFNMLFFSMHFKFCSFSKVCCDNVSRKRLPCEYDLDVMLSALLRTFLKSGEVKCLSGRINLVSLVGLNTFGLTACALFVPGPENAVARFPPLSSARCVRCFW